MFGFPSNWWLIARRASSATSAIPRLRSWPGSFLAKGDLGIGPRRETPPIRPGDSIRRATRRAIGSLARTIAPDFSAIRSAGRGGETDARAIQSTSPAISPTAQGIQSARHATGPTARGISPDVPAIRSGAPAIRSDCATRESLARQREALGSEQALEKLSITRFWLFSPLPVQSLSQTPCFIRPTSPAPFHLPTSAFRLP